MKYYIIIIILFAFVGCTERNEVVDPESELSISEKSSAPNSVSTLPQHFRNLNSLSQARSRKRMEDLDSLNLSRSEKLEFIKNYLQERKEKLYEVREILKQERSSGVDRRQFRDSLFKVYGFDKLLLESKERRKYIKEVVYPEMKRVVDKHGRR